MDSAPPSAFFADLGDQDNPGTQPRGERLNHSGLDCDHDSLLVMDFF